MFSFYNVCRKLKLKFYMCRMLNNFSWIISPSLYLAIFLLIIQQITVASSTIWLTKLIVAIPEGRFVLFWLGLYLASLILPYVPGALALIEIAKAKVQATIKYVHQFSKTYTGKVLEWTDEEKHKSKSAILGGEGYHVITDYVEYLYLLFSSALNVILNLLTLAFLIDSRLLISFVIGISLAIFLLRQQSKWRRRLALKAQQSRLRWTSQLLKAWDNVLLNNLYNFNIWSKKTAERSKRLEGKTVILESFNQAISILMAFALVLPSLCFIVFLYWKHIHEVQVLAVITVTLPRLFQVLTYSYELLFYTADFPLQSAKLETVLTLVNDHGFKSAEAEKHEFSKRIDWNQISLQMKPNEVINPITEEILKMLPQKGRITIQGHNGSGKTSFLLWLKMNHGDKAFYLPTKHNLLFVNSKNLASTGQRTIEILKEVANNIQAPIILLDEWDANLDKRNTEAISSLIDELAFDRCVIETRHQKHL